MRRSTTLVERLARVVAHAFYRIDTVGIVPNDGPLLLVANHPNALLDPAIVIATAGRTVRFIAKSTLFHGPLAPLLRASGAIPVFRRQDAGVDVKRNLETFAAVDAALACGDAVCIFPEGISHSTGRLEPLRTGAARMALSATSLGVPVQVVPIGINLDEKTAFRSHMTVVFGSPFAIKADARSSEVTAEIAERMRNLMVEADPGADAELVMRIDRLYVAERDTAADPGAAVERRRTIASGLERLRERDPARYETALLRLRRYDRRLQRFRLRDHALDWNPSVNDAARFVAREAPLALVLMPIAIVATILFAVPYFLTALVAKLQKDTDVTATAKVVSAAVFYTAWMITLAVLAGIWVGPASGLLLLVVLPVVAIAGLFAIERESAALQTATSWLALRGARPTTRRRLRRHRAELADILDEVNGWLGSRPSL